MMSVLRAVYASGAVRLRQNCRFRSATKCRASLVNCVYFSCFNRIISVVLAIVIGPFVLVSRADNLDSDISRAAGKFPAALAFQADTFFRDAVPVVRDSMGSCDVMTVLSMLAGSSVADEEPDSLRNQEYSVLDYLSDICEDNGFYETGSWEPAAKSPLYSLHVGPPPPVDSSMLRRPVKGRLNSPFGIRAEAGKIPLGLDFTACWGDTVRVALPGKVSRRGFGRRGDGWDVWVTDGNMLETRYAHLQKILVGIGDTVGCNMPVGLVGTSGNSTGPHLHFEVRYKGRVVDPTLLF